MRGAWFQFLLRELRSFLWCSQKVIIIKRKGFHLLKKKEKVGQVRESTWKVSSSKMFIPIDCDYVYVCVCVLSHFSCVWLFCDPVDCSLPGSSIHRILQARILEWVARPFSKGSSWSRDVIMCESEREVAQSCLTLCSPMDCRLLRLSVRGVFQARVLERGAISFSRESSQLRDRTWASRIVGRRFTIWATREVDYVCLSQRKHWGTTPSNTFNNIINKHINK